MKGIKYEQDERLTGHGGEHALWAEALAAELDEHVRANRRFRAWRSRTTGGTWADAVGAG